MASSRFISSDPTAFGFAPPHWRMIAAFARGWDYVLAFRAGKRAAVTWIEQSFPAKSLALKCKVDPKVGLLIAHDPDDCAQAERAGYPGLEPLGSSGELVARLGRADAFGGHKFTLAREPWAQRNLVMDPATRRPITSDYDLAGVVDTRRPEYYLTYASWAGSANRTNPLTAAVARELNCSPARASCTGARRSTRAASPTITANTLSCSIPTVTSTSLATCPHVTDGALHGLILKYFPDKAAWFRQYRARASSP